MTYALLASGVLTCKTPEFDGHFAPSALPDSLI